MIRFIELTSYKTDTLFGSVGDLMSHYSKLILEDYDKKIMEIDILATWDLFNGGLELKNIPTECKSDGLHVKFNEFIITSSGIAIQATIKSI